MLLGTVWVVRVHLPGPFFMQESKIFLGNTPSATRSFLLEAFRTLAKKYDRLVVPCCGQMAIPLTALKAGWKPEQIFASDVSLFSSVLGYYIMKTPLTGLKIEICGEPWPAPKDYATVLYWQKYYASLNQSRHYFQSIALKELRDRKDAHIAKIKESLLGFDCLKGMTYTVKDLFADVDEAIHDSKTVIWVNPPGYKAGYAKMYDTGEMIEWNEPQFEEFIPNDHHDLLREKAEGKPAMFIWYRYNELAPGDINLAVFADQKGTTRWDYTLANRPEEFSQTISPAKKNIILKHWKVLPIDYEITPQCEVSIKRVDEHTALYYRDLFIHRLGATSAVWNYLMLIDGFVAGTVGINSTGKWTRDPFDDYVEESYGITAPSERHPKLNRLLMMVIKSSAFLRMFDTLEFRGLGIATTCLSLYPELKVNRGIYKLVLREKLKNYNYRLRYQGDRTDQSLEEVLLEWLKKYS